MHTTPSDVATDIARQCFGTKLSVTQTSALHGGMINRVEEWFTDSEPSSLVAKISAQPDNLDFQAELDSLKYFQELTRFPVPTPYGLFSSASSSYLLMEKIPGKHMEEARMTAGGEARLQKEIARHVASLHNHKRDTYGYAGDSTGTEKWLDIFAPRIQGEFLAVRDVIAPQTTKTVEKLLDRLPEFLPEFGQPTLIHGDLWMTNILVDDTDPHHPHITGFVDGMANYAEVESELAYLRVFDTAGVDFFLEYTRHHALRPNFDQRCHIYWLNTYMLHVRLFGKRFLRACEKTASEIASFL